MRGQDEAVLMQPRNCRGRNVKRIRGHWDWFGCEQPPAPCPAAMRAVPCVTRLTGSTPNNHRRHVRLQYEPCPVFPDYRQDNDRWIPLPCCEQADWQELVSLWVYYNKYLAWVIGMADTAASDHVWHDCDGREISLRQMISGYLDHLYLHLNEIAELID